MKDLINEQPEQDIEHCATCIHAADSEYICILRKCKYAIAELKDCYKPEWQWTPCNERLPEEGIWVLTVDAENDYEINHLVDAVSAEWFWDGVVAWMPLPEPYKEEK